MNLSKLNFLITFLKKYWEYKTYLICNKMTMNNVLKMKYLKNMTIKMKLIIFLKHSYRNTH